MLPVVIKKIDEYDKCVKCGVVTPYKKTDHVDQRMYYLEGAGQLCETCGKKYC
jgi:hypothetical protein